MFMLNTMESQRNVGERLIPVAQYSYHSLNKAPNYTNSYHQIIKQRFLLNYILFLISPKVEFKFLLFSVVNF